MFETLTTWATEFIQQFGYLGIFLLTFTESFIQPIIPDPFIIGATSLGLDMDKTVLTVCIASVLGSFVGYFLGKTLGKPVFIKIFGEKVFAQGKKFFDKYGVWGVVIAGLTPIPFKVVTWLAGIFNLPFHKFVVASIVGRVPRFILMAYAGTIISKLFN